MIRLPHVTLFVLDCVTPQRSLQAVRFSVRWVRFAEVVVLTDLGRFRDLPREVEYKVPVRYVHCRETDRKVPRPGSPHPLPIDYELDLLRKPAETIKTSHYLHIEWDSGVLNPEAWDEDWLHYDFIGAPWPPHEEPGFPVCDGVTNAVGNGGFSLQSTLYAKAVSAMAQEFRNDPLLISSDMYPCRTKRTWLEEHYYVRFAPPEVAARFSCENRIYAGQFGFHGVYTAEMNNWAGPFFGGMRPAPPKPAPARFNMRGVFP